MAPLESTDGKYLYYPKGYFTTGIWRVPANGGDEVQEVDSLNAWPNFDVSSDGIYYVSLNTSRLGEIQGVSHGP